MITLYHGSNACVEKPEIRPMVRALDFGKAFYLTSSLEQATKWAKTTTLRRGDGIPIISVFEFDDSYIPELKVLRFDAPTAEWLRYVGRNRNLGVDEGNSDLVIGPVANDNTMPVLNLYFKGAYTEEEALRRLLPQRLCDQFAFKTDCAIGRLKFIKSMNVG